MKKFFSYLGIFSILICSFFYTEKTVDVVKEYDNVMIEIKNYSTKYEKKPIDAKIENNTIIPGIKGYKVNLNKSYNIMKKYGKFDENLIVYDDVYPDISINNNYDKYIINGNLENRKVSLIFIVDEYTNINDIISILKNNQIKANFFINKNYLENNANEILNLINQGYVIGNYGDDFNYLTGSFIWIDTVIKKIGKQSNTYCLHKEENIDNLNICKMYGNYSIKPIIIDNNYYSNIKNNLKSGSIISLNYSSDLINNLDLIIKYIKSKGYLIVDLNELISE